MIDRMNDEPTSERVLRAQDMLAALPEQMADRERIDEITALQTLIAVASARLARVSVDFDSSQRADQRRRGDTAKLVGKGIADQIALARGISPHSASNHLALAKALVEDLSCAFELWARREIDERTATGVAKQVFCFERADRQGIDHELASEIRGMSAQRAERAAKGAAAHRCPDAIATRAPQGTKRAASEHPTHRRHDGLSDCAAPGV